MDSPGEALKSVISFLVSLGCLAGDAVNSVWKRRRRKKKGKRKENKNVSFFRSPVMFCFHLFLLRLARGLTKTVIETSVQALMEVVNKIMGRPFKD